MLDRALELDEVLGQEVAEHHHRVLAQELVLAREAPGTQRAGCSDQNAMKYIKMCLQDL